MLSQQESFQMIAKTLHGLEPVLANELVELGASNVQELKRAVQFEGSMELLYRCNLSLRTALKILVPIHHFQAKNEKDLYRHVQAINWSKYIKVDQYLSVEAVLIKSSMTHSHYAALKVKDAIVDQFRERTGKRPSVNLKFPHLRVHLHISKDQGSLLIDSTGSPLFKRGYRGRSFKAPINEVLAAGMILLSGWTPSTPFINPMCGSGTLAIEAAMMAQNIPPATNREDPFAFERWPNFEGELWKRVKNQAKTNIKSSNTPIYASDQAFQAVEIAKGNARMAGVYDSIQFKTAPFESVLPDHQSGLVMINPPYGERIQSQELVPLYKAVGDQLKQHYAGHDAWVISSDLPALKQVGLRPSRKIELYNGALQCKFHKFELYRGSKKGKKE